MLRINGKRTNQKATVITVVNVSVVLTREVTRNMERNRKTVYIYI